ncbi:branched-chain amino acid ABC transporter permease [Dactylosporangium sp. NPDC051485]|uniref:branched-chain amino acid ABC transporter permease n=1 Tax=Dactylosporangium sp. NPDC051485 TaxID=3154846 RepID=UPI003414FF95
MSPSWHAVLRRGSGLPAPVSGLAATAALTTAGCLADPYTLSTWTRILSLGLLALSVAVLAGTCGLPSLGQVAPYAVGAYTTAILARHGITTGPVQLAAAATAAAVFSIPIGAAVARTRGITFLMVTLAVGELTAVAAGQWTTVTGGTDGLAGIPATQPWWGTAAMLEDRAVYGYALTVAVAVTAALWWTLRTPAGLLLRGCRDHETRMRASGHPVTRYLVAAYVAAGAIAGIGGALLVTGQRYVSPGDVGFEVAALVLLAVTIGGGRSLGGALAAVALVALVRDWAAATVPGRGPLLLGALFIAAVYVAPEGLAGLGRRRRQHPPVEAEVPSS